MRPSFIDLTDLLAFQIEKNTQIIFKEKILSLFLEIHLDFKLVPLQHLSINFDVIQDGIVTFVQSLLDPELYIFTGVQPDASALVKKLCLHYRDIRIILKRLTDSVMELSLIVRLEIAFVGYANKAAASLYTSPEIHFAFSIQLRL